jgi:hypothetical protein
MILETRVRKLEECKTPVLCAACEGRSVSPVDRDAEVALAPDGGCLCCRTPVKLIDPAAWESF